MTTYGMLGWLVPVMAGRTGTARTQPVAATGARLRLEAIHCEGVSAHRERRGTNAFGWVRDARRGIVDASAPPGRWLWLDFKIPPDGGVNCRSVFRQRPPNLPAFPDLPIADDRAVRPRRRTLCLTNCNISGFPKGCGPSHSSEANAAEFNRQAGTLTWLKIDVAAVQALLDYPSACGMRSASRSKISWISPRCRVAQRPAVPPALASYGMAAIPDWPTAMVECASIRGAYLAATFSYFGKL